MSGVGVVIPVKPFGLAKSRLAVPHRAEFARGMLLDTLSAVVAVVDRVVVVSEQPDLTTLAESLLTSGSGRVEVVADPGAGLNAAVRAGDRQLGGDVGVRVAMVADLPALRSADLDQVIRRARREDTSVVADRQGVGTTMILSTRGFLDPHFGPDSARRHAATGAVELTGMPPTARCDVDDRDDLAHAYGLGLGPHTSAILADTALCAQTTIAP